MPLGMPTQRMNRHRRRRSHPSMVVDVPFLHNSEELKIIIRRFVVDVSFVRQYEHTTTLILTLGYYHSPSDGSLLLLTSLAQLYRERRRYDDGRS